MRIAVVNPYARSGKYSGPNVFMERLFARLSDEHDITLVGGDNSAMAGYVWPIDVAVPCQFNPRSRSSQLRWALASGLWHLRNLRKFDVVHMHGTYLFNLAPFAIQALRRRAYILLPLSAGGEMSLTSRSARSSVGRYTRRYVVRRAFAGLALAPQISDELEAWGLSRDRVHAIGNAVDTDAFRPPVPDTRAGSRTIVFVGSISERKNPFVVLQALSLLHRAGNGNARIIFVGPYADEPSRKKFAHTVDTLGLSACVEVTGFQSTVLTYLHEASVFVLPSRQEGLPGALVEAMAAGLPVVVTDVGSMGEVVKSANCGYVVPADGAAIAEAIRKLWDLPKDWHLRSVSARAYAQAHYSVDAVAKAYQSVLDSIGARI